jgi:hypothetical protein
MGMERHDRAMETAARLTPRALVRRFVRERSGATAIEFALLALPFFLLLFAILESCITFTAQQLMTNAAEDVARQFRTGRVKAEDVDRVQVRKLLCDRMGALFPGDCPGLDIDLRSFATFEQAARLFDGGVLPAEYRFEPGGAGSKNVLRVFYRWPVITDIMRKSMSNLPDGKTLLFTSQTWQNEPFD